jgi:hypothetical protein
MGRPSSLDDATKARIVAAVEAGCGRRTAAQAAGVDRSTLLRWLAAGREGVEPFAAFESEVRAAEARCELANVATIQAASAKTWQAAAWLLERKHPERWARRDPAAERARRDERASTKKLLSEIPIAELEAMVAAEKARRGPEPSSLPSFFILMPPPLDDE